MLQFFSTKTILTKRHLFLYLFGSFLRKANNLNIKTACLPINNEDCIGRKVLTVNQVFEIMGQQLQSHDWKQSLGNILPQRKQQKKDEKEHVEPILNDEDDLSI